MDFQETYEPRQTWQWQSFTCFLRIETGICLKDFKRCDDTFVYRWETKCCSVRDISGLLHPCPTSFRETKQPAGVFLGQEVVAAFTFPAAPATASTRFLPVSQRTGCSLAPLPAATHNCNFQFSQKKPPTSCFVPQQKAGPAPQYGIGACAGFAPCSLSP